MTQSLRQSIEILQMSAHELADFIAEESLRNPLISVEYGGSSDSENDAAGEDAPMPSEAHATHKSDGESDDNWEERMAAGDDNFEAQPEYGLSVSGSKFESGNSFDEESPNLEKFVGQSKSLREHLLEQLYVDIIDPVARIVGLHLIDAVDDAGYLSSDDILAVTKTLGCPSDVVEKTILNLQKFDPIGVFARSLSECLALQLKELDRLDPAMEKLVNNLDLLAKRDFKTLHKICEIDAEDLTDMIAEIKALNPKPGMRYFSSEQSEIQPDVIVSSRHGKWVVELNHDVMPRVLVNSGYLDNINARLVNRDDKKCVSEYISNANWIVKAVEQRAMNTLKVAGEIVSKQQDFLKYGVTYLKPMVLKEISEAIGVHESTVSRITTAKYIMTPRGTYEMKYFFTSGIGNSFGGDNHSSEAVKHKIKQMIDAESYDKILSDDDIADTLKNDGINIARRTVAKYRESMNIGSSVQRRREKALLGA